MARFSGPQYPGATRDHREVLRQEANERARVERTCLTLETRTCDCANREGCADE